LSTTGTGITIASTRRAIQMSEYGVSLFGMGIAACSWVKMRCTLWIVPDGALNWPEFRSMRYSNMAP
jgi:hypothetical protein